MNIKKMIVFLVAFFFGLVFVPSPEHLVSENLSSDAKISTVPPIAIKSETKIPEEIVDWQEEDVSKFKIKLLETGEGFHGDEIKAKSGEIWLGLFQKGDKYFLRSTKLKILRAHDSIVDGENEKVKSGKSVFTNNKAEAVFLLKNARMLSEGEIKTVFFAEDYDKAMEFKNGSQKNFEFNGESYNLRIENKLTSDEFLTKGSKLILSHNGKEQILSYLTEGCNDCYWKLYWMGDLDKDGKLDFYFDLSGHYNVSDKRLFLSSPAKKGKLVKNVANFSTSGC